jgi:hypothetical protein
LVLQVGYTQVMTNCMANAHFLRQKLVETGKVRLNFTCSRL